MDVFEGSWCAASGGGEGRPFALGGTSQMAEYRTQHCKNSPGSSYCLQEFWKL